MHLWDQVTNAYVLAQGKNTIKQNIKKEEFNTSTLLVLLFL